MSEETVKKVKVDYTVEDHAAGPLGRIAHSSHEAGKGVEHLKEKFKEFRGEALLAGAGILGVGFGLGSLIDKAKDANAEFGGVQKSIASTMATILDWPKTMEPIERFQRSMVLSKGVTQELEESAGRFGMGLEDVARAYKTIGVSAGPLHLSQERWMDMAVKSAAAAKQFGIDGAQAADLVGKALMGKPVKAAGDFGKYLSNEVGKPIKGMNNASVLEKLDRALTQSAGIAEQMGKGVGGSIARIQLRVGEMFREVTGPLFREVAGTLDAFSKKLKDGGESGKSLREAFSDKLVTVFKDLKAMTGFLSDHWKEIAVVVGGMKLNGLVRDLGGVAGNMAKAIGAIGQGVGAGGIMGFVGALGPAIAGLYALKIALDAFGEWLDKKTDEWQAQKMGSQNAGASMSNLGAVARHGEGPLTSYQDKAVKQSLAQLSKAGIVDANGDVKLDKFRETWSGMAMEQKQKMIGEFGVKAGPNVDYAKEMAYKVADVVERFYTKAPPNAGETDANRKTTGKPQVVFTGENHFDFKWEDVDPERAMLRFKDDMENYVGRRTSANMPGTFGG